MNIKGKQTGKERQHIKFTPGITIHIYKVCVFGPPRPHHNKPNGTRKKPNEHQGHYHNHRHRQHHHRRHYHRTLPAPGRFRPATGSRFLMSPKKTSTTRLAAVLRHQNISFLVCRIWMALSKSMQNRRKSKEKEINSPRGIRI